ncbi:hypothetical protein SCHPADRAFT_268636 [Schizopora paradoxa]|uniref:Uncharacterized protein n=1 Tax=Schizopora paradoxa TaxID=27342 RepID=A0A0H2RTH1_9AGAM|nr:hypothetical protein SCHPADRAFT_268636 [Schizopora paradoxa]
MPYCSLWSSYYDAVPLFFPLSVFAALRGNCSEIPNFPHLVGAKITRVSTRVVGLLPPPSTIYATSHLHLDLRIRTRRL